MGDSVQYLRWRWRRPHVLKVNVFHIKTTSSSEAEGLQHGRCDRNLLLMGDDGGGDLRRGPRAVGGEGAMFVR
jgi:hypothetical protein